jgi:hypothetical protein
MEVGCEQFRDAIWGQPTSTVTSLAFVVAGVVVIATRHRRAPLGGGRYRVRARLRLVFGALVAAVGVGSVVQHGPHPDWQAYAHDLTLAGVLAFLAVDAAADLTGRRWRARWWLVPTATVAPMVAIGPAASTAAQAALGALAIGLNLWRAWVRPDLRRALLVTLAVLAAGALAGNLGDRSSLCRPDSLLQGHAVWHLMAALALWWVAPVVGSLPGAAPAPEERAGREQASVAAMGDTRGGP